MEKKFQIFISSTFADLEKERGLITKSILDLGHIPAGMEAFPASDEDLFEYITDVIDNCDYYVLIVRGRYGSISEKTGLSFTEMEYDYACENKIPVVAFLYRNPDELPAKETDQDSVKRDGLKRFRSKVSSGRIVRFWNSVEELASMVPTSLSRSFKKNPRPGWVRGEGPAREELLIKINELRDENDYLKSLSTAEDDFRGVLGLIDDGSVRIQFGERYSGEFKVLRVIDALWSHVVKVALSATIEATLSNDLSTYLEDLLWGAYGEGDDEGRKFIISPAFVDRVKFSLKGFGLIESIEVQPNGVGEPEWARFMSKGPKSAWKITAKGARFLNHPAMVLTK